MRYWRHQHLRKASDFQEIRASGKRWECGFFYVNFLPRPGLSTPLRRVGIIASKRIGNAVARNRAKRLLRETFRLNQELLPGSCDMVLIARAHIRHAGLSQLERKFAQAAKTLDPPTP